MKAHYFLLILTAAGVLLAGCRIGGGFDSAGRLRDQPIQIAEVSTAPEKTDTSETAQTAPLIYWITPAG